MGNTLCQSLHKCGLCVRAEIVPKIGGVKGGCEECGTHYALPTLQHKHAIEVHKGEMRVGVEVLEFLAIVC